MPFGRTRQILQLVRTSRSRRRPNLCVWVVIARTPLVYWGFSGKRIPIDLAVSTAASNASAVR